MQLLDAGDPAFIPLQEALKKAKAQAFRDVRSQEEETFGGSRTGNLGGHQASRCSQSRGRGRGEKTCWVEGRTCQRGVDEIAHLKALLVAAEEERDAASIHRKDKPQCPWGSHTDRPHSSHAVFGASRVESVVARSTTRSRKPSNWVARQIWCCRSHLLSDGAVRLMELNGGMVP